MASIEYTQSGGTIYRYFFEPPVEAVEANVGTVVTLGRIDAVQEQVVLRRSLRWEPNRDYYAGESVIVDDLSKRRIFIVVLFASNQEGRGLTSNATAVVNPTKVIPSAHPVDLNLSGPGLPQAVGPALRFADRLMGLTDAYDVAIIVSLATGNQTLDSYYVSGGPPNYEVQRDDNDGMHGAQGLGTRCLMKASDDYILLTGGGEGDANSGQRAGWAAEKATRLAAVRADYPSSTCKAQIIFNLASEQEESALQSNWTIVKGEIGSMDNPSGSPPTFVVSYDDSGKKAGDEIHYGATHQESRADVGILRLQQDAPAAASLSIPHISTVEMVSTGFANGCA